MPLFRKYIRLWFGLKALGLFISIVSFLFAISKGQMEVNRARLIATVVGALALDLSAGIAWWTLKKHKPSGRTWAIIASTCGLVPSSLFLILKPGHFVFTIFAGGILSVAGLVAFAARNSAIEIARARQKSRIFQDGTSKFKDYLAQAISMGIIWLAFQLWNQWAASHGLARPGLISYLVQLNVAVLLTTLFHELGHLATGWASGKILRVFQVGPFRWAVRNGKWRFEFQLRKFYGGGVAMVAPDLRNMRRRQIFLLMGGPAASLVVGLTFSALTLTAGGHVWQPYWSLLSTLATLSIAGFAVNMIPLKPESQYSDGAQIYQILTNGPWARVHLAFAMVTTSAVAPIRPRDFDMNVINQATDFVRHGERGLLLRMVACKHYVDKNRIPEAIANMEEAEDLYDECKFEKPQDICAEFVFVNALYKRNLAAADLWWQRIEALRKVDPNADYWRAKTALLWLKGEQEEAFGAWERGNAAAQQLPAAGTYDFTRSCFKKLRKALDNPIRIAPSVAPVFEWAPVAFPGVRGSVESLPLRGAVIMLPKVLNFACFESNAA
jgi:hypothetical protein